MSNNLKKSANCGDWLFKNKNIADVSTEDYRRIIKHSAEPYKYIKTLLHSADAEKFTSGVPKKLGKVFGRANLTFQHLKSNIPPHSAVQIKGLSPNEGLLQSYTSNPPSLKNKVMRKMIENEEFSGIREGVHGVFSKLRRIDKGVEKYTVSLKKPPVESKRTYFIESKGGIEGLTEQFKKLECDAKIIFDNSPNSSQLAINQLCNVKRGDTFNETKCRQLIIGLEETINNDHLFINNVIKNVDSISNKILLLSPDYNYSTSSSEYGKGLNFCTPLIINPHQTKDALFSEISPSDGNDVDTIIRDFLNLKQEDHPYSKQLTKISSLYDEYVNTSNKIIDTLKPYDPSSGQSPYHQNDDFQYKTENILKLVELRNQLHTEISKFYFENLVLHFAYSAQLTQFDHTKILEDVQDLITGLDETTLNSLDLNTSVDLESPKPAPSPNDCEDENQLDKFF